MKEERNIKNKKKCPVIDLITKIGGFVPVWVQLKPKQGENKSFDWHGRKISAASAAKAGINAFVSLTTYVIMFWRCCL